MAVEFYKQDSNQWQGVCLSSDTKPKVVGSRWVPSGSTLLETDTGNSYAIDGGGTWRQEGGSGGPPTQEVVGVTSYVTVTPTITAGAYAANQNLGGLQTLALARVSGGNGILQSVHITDHANQGPTLGAMDLLFFDSTPAGTFTDNAAFPTLGQPANAKSLGRVRVLTGDWETIGGSAFATVTVGIVLAAAGSANIIMAIMMKQAPTYAAATDLSFRFGFLQN